MNYKRRTPHKKRQDLLKILPPQVDCVLINYEYQYDHLIKYRHVLHNIETKNYKLTDKTDSWFWYLMGY